MAVSSAASEWAIHAFPAHFCWAIRAPNTPYSFICEPHLCSRFNAMSTDPLSTEHAPLGASVDSGAHLDHLTPSVHTATSPRRRVRKAQTSAPVPVASPTDIILSEAHALPEGAVDQSNPRPAKRRPRRSAASVKSALQTEMPWAPPRWAWPVFPGGNMASKDDAAPVELAQPETPSTDNQPTVAAVDPSSIASDQDGLFARSGLVPTWLMPPWLRSTISKTPNQRAAIVFLMAMAILALIFAFIPSPRSVLLPQQPLMSPMPPSLGKAAAVNQALTPSESDQLLLHVARLERENALLQSVARGTAEVSVILSRRLDEAGFRPIDIPALPLDLGEVGTGSLPAHVRQRIDGHKAALIKKTPADNRSTASSQTQP